MERWHLNDVYFYKLGERLGIDTLARYARPLVW